MKTKIIMLTIAAVTMLCSCKKNYECHCEKTAGGDEHFDIKAKNKGDAESECVKKKEGSTVYKECHLD